VPVPHDQVAVLVADMAEHTGALDHDVSDSSGVLHACSDPSRLVALTSWGDRLVLQGDCHGYEFGDLSWTPGPEAQQVLDDLSGPGR
jgi:hypothetical protein